MQRPLARLALAAALACAPHSVPVDVAHEEAQGAHIEALLSGAPGRLVLGEPLREREALARVYAARGYQPAWLGAKHDDRGSALLEALRSASAHGLPPEPYHTDALAAHLWRAGGGSSAEGLAALDLLLSDAFLHLARHLAEGAVDPRTLHPRYRRGEPPPDAVDVLSEALRSGAVAEALEGLAPPHPEYGGLRSALARLRSAAAAGGWPGVPAGPDVEPGARDDRIPALRARLAWPAAPAPPAGGDPLRLDAPLADALRAFQQRHGLAPDGILGPRSSAELAATVAERVDQVRANLERWRWLPRDFGSRHVRVNAAGFVLQAFDAGRPLLDMRVVVGCTGWETPLLHGAVTHLVLNPAWDVPRSIAVREMLPRARREPGYFAAQGLQVLADEGDGAPRRAVDPASVDWSAVSAERFPYHLRQPPGPRNPLGRIKFLFPNPFGVYLHGTPGRAALERPVRTLSHGCVRVEDEIALGVFALAPDPAWTRERLLEALETAHERRLALPEPLDVHILYLTAGAEEDGTPTFTEDPYGWDPPLVAALEPHDPGRSGDGHTPCMPFGAGRRACDPRPHPRYRRKAACSPSFA